MACMRACVLCRSRPRTVRHTCGRNPAVERTSRRSMPPIAPSVEPSPGPCCCCPPPRRAEAIVVWRGGSLLRGGALDRWPARSARCVGRPLKSRLGQSIPIKARKRCRLPAAAAAVMDEPTPGGISNDVMRRQQRQKRQKVTAGPVIIQLLNFGQNSTPIDRFDAPHPIKLI